MHSVLKLAQLRWTGHVIRMPDERLPKTVFVVISGELQEGKRSQDGQKKCYIETLKASLKDFDIPMGSWKQTAQERSTWRGLVNKGAALYEKRASVKLKESTENERQDQLATTDFMTLTCSTYNRQFRARICIISHQRTTQTYSRNILSLFFLIPYSLFFIISERRTTRHVSSRY